MALEHTSDSALARAVRKVGSQSAFARLLGTRQSTIFGWLKNAKDLPAEHARLVSDATGIPLHELRPDIFLPDDQMPDEHAGGSPAAATIPPAAAGVQDPVQGLQS
ncbi:MAG: hypothetical protein DI555_06435 [Novosphingobium pentaromativorans]|uniref:HTH cro/C1-type domain-containing protein n=1 Tax=Novosphingobium pentaromativorans TaxID=205844 RepID=A0A2W5QF52_9SPHN|nr:MAG: hypothetical protein DI555_06435 [Novosphingobium pentaromativorans]